jgi:hypothetical protein
MDIISFEPQLTADPKLEAVQSLLGQSITVHIKDLPLAPVKLGRKAVSVSTLAISLCRHSRLISQLRQA